MPYSFFAVMGALIIFSFLCRISKKLSTKNSEQQEFVLLAGREGSGRVYHFDRQARKCRLIQG